MNAVIIGVVMLVLATLVGAFLLDIVDACLRLWTRFRTGPLGKLVRDEALNTLEEFLKWNEEKLRADGYTPAQIACKEFMAYFVRPLPGHVLEFLRGIWAAALSKTEAWRPRNQIQSGGGATVSIGSIPLVIAPSGPPEMPAALLAMGPLRSSIAAIMWRPPSPPPQKLPDATWLISNEHPRSVRR